MTHTSIARPNRYLVIAAAALVASCVATERTDEAGAQGGESVVQFQATDFTSGSWYKGNTHAHTTNSDGDSSPEYVATWYRDHGYAFLVLSDHNVFTDPETLAHLTGPDFLLIPGEEVTSSLDGKALHMNGLNIPGVIEAATGESVVEIIQENVDAVRAVGGVPHINHPNFTWAFGAEELAQVQRDRLLEIYNGHPLVHNEGGGGFRSMERMWDLLLTGGKVLYGIAVDDAHNFQGEFSALWANPGRGWVMVRTENLDPLSIVTALEEGRFYASTGVELASISITDQSISIEIDQAGVSKYTTEFIGPDSEVLATVHGLNPSYQLQGDEAWVRATVRQSDGFKAWVQPVFTESRN